MRLVDHDIEGSFSNITKSPSLIRKIRRLWIGIAH
jgi:hypothetical protein